MVRKFKLPPKITVPRPNTTEDASRLLSSIVAEANERSASTLGNMESMLDQTALRKLTKAAGAEDTNVFLRNKFNRASSAYVCTITGIASYPDPESGRDITTGTISNTITEIADIIGENPTEQIYKTITSNIDSVLKERYNITEIPAINPVGEIPEKRREEIRLCAQYLMSVFNNIESGIGGLREFSTVLGHKYNDKHPYNNVDFQDNLETIKHICDGLIKDPDRLKENGQELFRMTRPVVDAWLMDQTELLSGDTKISIKENDDTPTPENMVALVDAADRDITREKEKRSNFDLMPVTLTHLCKQWMMMSNESIDRAAPNSSRSSSSNTVLNDLLKTDGSLPVITMTPQGDGKITLSVQVDLERLPRSQAGGHPMEDLRVKAAKELGLPVSMSLNPPSLHWSNCTPDQIAELYPKIVDAFLDKQRSITVKLPPKHDI